MKIEFVADGDLLIDGVPELEKLTDAHPLWVAEVEIDAEVVKLGDIEADADVDTVSHDDTVTLKDPLSVADLLVEMVALNEAKNPDNVALDDTETEAEIEDVAERECSLVRDCVTDGDTVEDGVSNLLVDGQLLADNDDSSVALDETEGDNERVLAGDKLPLALRDVMIVNVGENEMEGLEETLTDTVTVLLSE